MTPDLGKGTGREPYGQAFGEVGGRNVVGWDMIMELSDPRTASGEKGEENRGKDGGDSWYLKL